MDNDKYLKTTFFIDFDSLNIVTLAQNIAEKSENDLKRIINIFNYVRDSIKYTVEDFQLDNPEKYKASFIIQKKRGFCIPKALALVALLRASSFPSRLHFADIINHRSSKNLLKIMGTNVFAFHGYTEVLVDQRWIKLTPSFDKALCERQNLPLCVFDGKNDAIFSSIDNFGKPFIEYIKDRGTYADLPYKEIIDTMNEFYGNSLLVKVHQK